AVRWRWRREPVAAPERWGAASAVDFRHGAGLMTASPPVRSEILPNGAGVCWMPALRKWAVVDGANRVHAYRVDEAAARELAARLPGRPPEPAPPAEPVPIPRSPAALPLPPATYL